MLCLDVFAVFIEADHVDMVVGPMFKLASSKISTISASSIFIEYSPHDGFRCIRGQHHIAFLDNTDDPRFSCVDLCFGSFKCLCLSRYFEYKSLGGLLNRGQNHFVDDSVTSHVSPRNDCTGEFGKSDCLWKVVMGVYEIRMRWVEQRRYEGETGI